MKSTTIILCLLLVASVTNAQIEKCGPLDYASADQILKTARQVCKFQGQYLQVRVLFSPSNSQNAKDLYFAVSWLPDTVENVFEVKGLIEPTLEKAIPDRDGEAAIISITSGLPMHRTTLKYAVYSEEVDVYQPAKKKTRVAP